MKGLSIVVPVLDEEAAIEGTLRAIRRGAPRAEIVVADGRSGDRSLQLARPLADIVLSAPRGRARQMNAGAAASSGDSLAFVHADTLVPMTFASDIARALEDEAVVGGRFDVRLDAEGPVYRLIGAMISARSRLSRTGTGDQAIFVRRAVFNRLGGFAVIDLCEDLDFMRRLKRTGHVACLRSRVVTSARRWERDGVLRTIVKMWSIRLLFLAGLSPDRLKRFYRDTR